MFKIIHQAKYSPYKFGASPRINASIVRFIIADHGMFFSSSVSCCHGHFQVTRRWPDVDFIAGEFARIRVSVDVKLSPGYCFSNSRAYSKS